MKISMFNRNSGFYLTAGLLAAALFPALSFPAAAQVDMRSRPSLVITNKPSRNNLGAPSSPIMTPPPADDMSAMPPSNLRTSSYGTPPPANYNGPIRTPDITPAQISGRDYFQPTQTAVGQKARQLKTDLTALQSRIGGLSGQLKNLQGRTLGISTEYNATIATINTQLQMGTTPGNPRLVQKLSVAEGDLDKMSQDVADLNAMAVDTANAASTASFLLDGVHSAYSLSGAVEEDHMELTQIEDGINSTTIDINRILNDVNDDLTRTSGYLAAERSNLRTLSLAVSNGDYYGRSLANRTFGMPGAGAPPVAPMGQAYPAAYAPPPVSPMSAASSYPNDMGGGPGQNVYPSGIAAPGMASSGGQAQGAASANTAYQPAFVTPMPNPGSGPAGVPGAPRLLVKIKFDQPNVDYQQPVYSAVGEALQKYPNARFQVVAVTPTSGNAAQVAIEKTRARRNAEGVLRTLSQMGVDVNKVDLTTQQSADARTNEVHIFLR